MTRSAKHTFNIGKSYLLPVVMDYSSSIGFLLRSGSNT